MINELKLTFPYAGKIMIWFISKNSFVRLYQPLALILTQNRKLKIWKSPYRGVIDSLLLTKFKTFAASQPLLIMCPPSMGNSSTFKAHESCNDNSHDSLKKLFLVLDLDHTLLHSSKCSEGREMSEKNRIEMFDFVSSQEFIKPHYIKLRPYLGSFLNSLKPFFEMAVYTMGTKEYAEQIGNVLDPKKEIFKGRIVSRDDFPDQRMKRMENLLHCNDNNICIIDDNSSVWEEKESVLKIFKYRFWPNEGDINSLEKKSDDFGDSADYNELGKGSYNSGREGGSSEDLVPFERVKKCKELDFTKMKQCDKDNVLLSYKNILKAIYVLYFSKVESPVGGDSADQNRDMQGFKNVNSLRALGSSMGIINSSKGKSNDGANSAGGAAVNTKQIIRLIKRSVLKGTVVYFLNCFPPNCNPSTQRIWVLAESLGSNCLRAFSERVTHVVCGNDTPMNSLEMYKGKSVYLVNQNWVYDSAVHFRKSNEEKHEVGGDEQFEGYTEDVVHYSNILKKVFAMNSFFR